jgi:hypothetical protein
LYAPTALYCEKTKVDDWDDGINSFLRKLAEDADAFDARFMRASDMVKREVRGISDMVDLFRNYDDDERFRAATRRVVRREYYKDGITYNEEFMNKLADETFHVLRSRNTGSPDRYQEFLAQQMVEETAQLLGIAAGSYDLQERTAVCLDIFRLPIALEQRLKGRVIADGRAKPNDTTDVQILFCCVNHAIRNDAPIYCVTNDAEIANAAKAIGNQYVISCDAYLAMIGLSAHHGK